MTLDLVHANDCSTYRGILGYGSIGRQIARVTKALGMDVYAYTLHTRPTPESRQDDTYMPPGLGDPTGALPSRWFSGGSTDELHQFLGSGLGLLVIAAPLTDATRGLVSKPELKVLEGSKPFVVNVSRGPLINTNDLVWALNNGIIGGAALDVTEPEPLPAWHPLWSARNVIITPNISGGSTDYSRRVLDILALNLEKLSEGGRLKNVVSRVDGY